MSIANTSAPRTPHDLSHYVFSCGKIGRLMTLSTIPVLGGDSFEQDLVGSLRLSPFRRGLSIDSKVDIFTFYIPHRHIYGDAWIELMKEGYDAEPIVDNYPVELAFSGACSALGINGRYGRAIPKWAWDGYKNIWNNYFKVPYDDDLEGSFSEWYVNTDAQFGQICANMKSIWSTPLPPERGNDTYIASTSGSETSIDLMDLNAQYGILHSEQERQLYAQRYRDVVSMLGGSTYYDADNRPQLKMRSSTWASGYDVDGTDQSTLGQFTGRVVQSFKHSVPRCFIPEHGIMWTVALVRFPLLHQEERHYLVNKSNVTYEDYVGDPAISGNHPPVPIVTSDFFGLEGLDQPLGVTPHSQWLRYQPPTVHNLYAELQGYPFLSDFNFTDRQNLYVNSSDYDDMFQNTQLGHWNMQARNNVSVLRTLPTARDSAITSN